MFLQDYLSKVKNQWFLKFLYSAGQVPFKDLYWDTIRRIDIVSRCFENKNGKNRA